jgi:hypothetical protein
MARHCAIGRDTEFIMEFRIGEMKNLLRIFPLLIIAMGALLLFEQPAYAYADPGTGLLAVQAAGSAIIAAGWYLRRKISGLFRRDVPTRNQPEQAVFKEDESSSRP